MLINFSLPCCALKQLTTSGLVIAEHRKLSVSVVLVSVFCRFENGGSPLGLVFPSMSHPCTALALHAQAEEISLSMCVLLAFCDWTTVPPFATKEVLLDLKGKGNGFFINFVLFYFKPVFFLERCQIHAVLCKLYAVMSKQFLPSGTKSRFSHNCHNSDERMEFGD